MQTQSVTIAVGSEHVSGLWQCPPHAEASYVVAHGAGAGMRHPFMAGVANGLAARAIATLRYQFPYMERGSNRPDTPAVAQAAVRAAVEMARRLEPGLPLVAGGKSFGGRMTSQAQSASPLPGVRGIVFLGFPLHAAGKPSAERATHLFDVNVPMLFLQGTRDALANLGQLRPTIDRLGSRATLVIFEGADHSFHVPKTSGRTDAGVLNDLLDTTAQWVQQHARA